MQGERAASSPGPDPRDPAAIAQATIEQPINDVATEVSGNPMPMVPDHERPLGRSDGLIEHVPVGDPTGKVETSVVVGRATAKAETSPDTPERGMADPVDLTGIPMSNAQIPETRNQFAAAVSADTKRPQINLSASAPAMVTAPRPVAVVPVKGNTDSSATASVATAPPAAIGAQASSLPQATRGADLAPQHTGPTADTNDIADRKSTRLNYSN